MVSDSSAPVESLRLSLFVELLNSLGEARLRVTGSSMQPAVWAGDLLTVRRCVIDDACVGDIVLYARDERVFAHRVVGRTVEGLLTRGDALDAPDAPVAADQFLGRVTIIERSTSFFTRVVRRGRQLRRRLVAA